MDTPVKTPEANDRKPAMGFWAFLVGLVAVLYVLSFGPAIWMLDRGVLPRSSSTAVERVYYPLVYGMTEGPRPVRKLIEWYAALGARPRDARLFDDPAIQRLK